MSGRSLRCTLDRYMTSKRVADMAQGGHFGTSLDSQTTESKVYKSPTIKMDGLSVSVKLMDTVGFGA